MLPGFSGHLVSEFFLERHLSEQSRETDRSVSRRRELVEWRKRCQALGPASSLRALFEIGAEGFVACFVHSGSDWPGSEARSLEAEWSLDRSESRARSTAE